jgi:hypothetical protein
LISAIRNNIFAVIYFDRSQALLMANIKTRYGEITRNAKLASPKAEHGATASSAGAQEEARLAAKIRERVRLDYKTLSTQKTSAQD